MKIGLQHLRLMTGVHFDELFNDISKFAVDVLPYLPFIIFWSINKKGAIALLPFFNISGLVTSLVKQTARIYRPWVRSSLIHPAGDSINAATGYSFPSGHSADATAIYGSLSVWQRKSHRIISIAAAIMIVLTGFSRNFLGVHTPEDVLFGICSASLIIFLVLRVERRIRDDASFYDFFTFLGISCAAVSILYILLKSYPMDYVNGSLIVDPQFMLSGSFKPIGWFCGFIIASYLERHFVQHEIPAGARILPLLTGCGILIMMAWNSIIGPTLFIGPLGECWGNFFYCLTFNLIGIVLYPMIISKMCREEVAVHSVFSAQLNENR